MSALTACRDRCSALILLSSNATVRVQINARNPSLLSANRPKCLFRSSPRCHQLHWVKRDPAKAARGLAHALKPGGTLAVE